MYNQITQNIITWYPPPHCTSTVLVYVYEDNAEFVTTLAVIHLIKKQLQAANLPLPFHASMICESCGIGFDSSTNTVRMVCALLQGDPAVKKQCTMVHVFGTSSWK